MVEIYHNFSKDYFSIKYANIYILFMSYYYLIQQLNNIYFKKDNF